MTQTDAVASRTQPDTPAAPTVQRPSRRRWLVLAVLAAVAFMAQLDMFIVNVALPEMGAAFHTPLNNLSWVLNGYAIVLAALLVPVGRLADQFGRRRFLLAGVVVFTAASAICAIAPTLPVLVAGRVIQGVGAAMIVPTSLGLLFPAFPKREHNLVVGLWAGVAAIAAASGPTVGGLLVTVDWRWIFLINVPIGIATVVGGLRVLPEVRTGKGEPLPDATSGLTLLAAVALFTLALVQSAQWGWTSPATLLVLAAAILAGIVAVRRAFTHPHAVVEAALFRSSREFTAAAAGLFLFFNAFAAWLLINVLFFQGEWHYSALHTGVAIVPGPFCAAIFALNAGRITGRFGRRAPAIAGALCYTTGALFWLLTTTAQPHYLAFLPGLIVAGSGAGLIQAPLFASANTLPDHRATTGSAVLNMARQVGSAVGVAILVTLLASAPTGSITGYHRGFAFMVTAGLAAAIAISLTHRPARIG